MKGSKFFYLVVAAAILAVAAWYLHRSEKSSWQERALPSGADLLAAVPVNDIAVVALRGPDGGTVTLRRGEGGWIVEERAGYPADFGKIADFVRKLSVLKALQSVPVAEVDRGALALRVPGEGVPAEEACTVVELSDASGGDIASLLLGKIHHTSPVGMRPEMGAAATGRYVMTGRESVSAYLVAEAFTDLRASPSAWIDAAFVRPGSVRRLEVTAEGKGRSWTLEREMPGAPWKLAGAKPDELLDVSKLMSLDSLLGGMSVSDAPDGLGDARVRPLEEAPVTVVAETFEGLRYAFTIGEGAGDNLPVKVAVQTLPEATAATAAAGPSPDPTSDEIAKESDTKPTARDRKLAEAGRFMDRVVFVPRNFIEIFLKPRAALLASPVPKPLPVASAPPKKK